MSAGMTLETAGMVAANQIGAFGRGSFTTHRW
jgi:hypothetical protein